MTDIVLSPAAAEAQASDRSGVIRAVAAKELMEMRRDRRLLALFLFYLVLMCAAIGFGAAENIRISRERSAAAEADRLLWIGQGAKNPHAAAHFGQYAFKPVSPPIPGSIPLSARRCGLRRTSRTKPNSGRRTMAASPPGSAVCLSPSCCKPLRRSSSC
jgi:hypothetical protein